MRAGWVWAGLLVSFAAGCDRLAREAPTTTNAGTSGTGGRADASTAGQGGSSDEAPGNVDRMDDSYGGEAAVEVARDACELMCAWYAALSHYSTCRAGDRYRYGQLIVEDGGGGADPLGPPRSTDEGCIEYCVWDTFQVPENSYDCWQQAAAVNECDAKATWVCDGTGWGTIECDALFSPTYCDP